MVLCGFRSSMMMCPGYWRRSLRAEACTDRMHLREVVTVAISWPGSKGGFVAPPVAVPRAPRFLAQPSRSVLERGDVSLVSGSGSFCELVSDPAERGFYGA